MVIFACGSQRRALLAAFGPQATPPMMTMLVRSFMLIFLLYASEQLENCQSYVGDKPYQCAGFRIEKIDLWDELLSVSEANNLALSYLGS